VFCSSIGCIKLMFDLLVAQGEAQKIERLMEASNLLCSDISGADKIQKY